jgi:hypothetical protein
MSTCEHTSTSFSERFDAEFCTSCGAWLANMCADPDCDTCIARPALAP